MKIDLDGIIYRFRSDCFGEYINFGYGDEFKCEHCEMALDISYCSIMNLLKEAKLLPEDFKHLCCTCYFFDRVGLLDIESEFDGWMYGVEDSLVLDYWMEDVGEMFSIRVHDYKKYLFS